MANEMRDRLVELILDKGIFDKQVCDLCTKDDYCERCGAECIADHLIENGVIVPPCKVGDTVYCIEHKTIHECIVTLVKSLTYENETIFFVETECEVIDPFYSDGRKTKHGITAVWEIEWGSWCRAFSTKEQAEQKLKEMRGDNANST